MSLFSISKMVRSQLPGRRFAAAALVLITLGCLAPARADLSGKIVFDSDRKGKPQIYIMNAGGGSQTRLTTNTASDTNPTFSPDGTQIIFQSDRDGNSEIYIMDLDGSNQTNLSINTAEDTLSDIDPATGRVFFTSNRDGDNEIFTMDADGSVQTQLTVNTANDNSPRLKPDSAKVVFVSDRNGNNEIYSKLLASPFSETRLTNNAASDVAPSYDPTGANIVFGTDRNAGVPQIFTMTNAGLTPTQLSGDTSTGDFNPRFALDGSAIVFDTDRDGNLEIYIMTTSGLPTEQRITNHAGDDQHPDWSYKATYGTATISDVTVSEADAFVQRNGVKYGEATFTVTLSAAAGSPVTINYTTDSVTATKTTSLLPVTGADYTTASGSVAIASGQSSGTIVVRFFDDLISEGDETFTVTLGNPTNARLGADTVAIGTITDNEPLPTLSVNSPPITYEGSAVTPGSVTFTVTLSASNTNTITVKYATVAGPVGIYGAVAGNDYVADNGTLTFAPGETKKTVTINFSGDSVAELNEKVFLDITNPTNATVLTKRGAAYIRNDDGPGITITNATSVYEGNSGTTPQTFTVTLSAVSTDTITVKYATANGTAIINDFVATSGTLTFAPGETSKTITVQVNGDTFVELTEKYFVNLSVPTFAVFSDSQASGFIKNDDTLGIQAIEEPSS